LLSPLQLYGYAICWHNKKNHLCCNINGRGPSLLQMTTFHQHILPIRHKLYRFALSITGSSHEAEDVIQDVLTSAWRTSENPDREPILNWEAWCMTLTRNRSLDRKRMQAKHRADDIEQAFHLSAQQETPYRTTENRDTLALVQRLMAQLPEKQRLTMHLRDVEEMTYDEIADYLEITLDQVKTNLHRARKTIRENLLKADL
jgi:RNA polymerase sigma factor (sigma-70 family)